VIEEEDSRSGISKMSKHEILRKFSYKGGKKETIPLYSKNYVNEERGCRNPSFGLVTKAKGIARVRA
jgi:hypothetical protein